MAQKYGAWGNGLVNSVPQFNLLLPYINGFNFRYPWTDLQTAPGVFTFTDFDTQLDYAFDNNLYVGFMIFTGPNAPIQGGNNWLASFVPTFTNDRGTWPYYMDPDYAFYWYAMTDAVIAHIAAYPAPKKAKILFMMSAEGSTGDEGPYKSTVPAPYVIDTDPGAEWDQFKRAYWLYVYNKLAADFPTCQLLVNQGNDGGNYTWLLDNTPKVWMKAGNFTHTYSILGEKEYAARLDVLRSSPTDDNRVRGEFEGTDDQPWWSGNTKQNFFTLMASAIHANIDIFNISAATHVTNGYTSFPYDFYDRYAGVRTALEANKGFCMLREEIDIGDIVRFPEGTGIGQYGDLITQSVSVYNNRYNNIVNQLCPPLTYNNCYSAPLVDDRIVSLKVTLNSTATNYKYMNPTRVANIRADFPSSAYQLLLTDQQRDTWNNDYILDGIPDNYYRFVTQYSPNTTSKGYWRLGASNQYFGRYARGFDVANGKTEMFFIIDPDLTSGGDDEVEIQVTYLDEGTHIWSLNCATCKGKSELQVVQNKNSNTWITMTRTVDKLLIGGFLEHGSDFTLKHLSGGDTIFALIEITNNSKILS